MVGQLAIIYINVEYTGFLKMLSEQDHLVDKLALAERTGIVVGSLLSWLLYLQYTN